jgi:phosphoserine aminotransferase
MADFSVAAKPVARPQNPNFSSGPCAKRPGFSAGGARRRCLGRSHRAKGPKAKLAEVISLSAQILGMPEGWRLGIVPASDTGAIEMALVVDAGRPARGCAGA